MKKRIYHNGKRVSKGEKQISLFLDKHKIKYIPECSFIGCNGLKGKPLRFDFYIEDRQICIEYQGEHHYKPINKYQRAKRVHKTTMIHDNIKRQFLSSTTAKLLEIPYWEYDNISDILQSILL